MRHATFARAFCLVALVMAGSAGAAQAFVGEPLDAAELSGVRAGFGPDLLSGLQAQALPTLGRENEERLLAQSLVLPRPNDASLQRLADLQRGGLALSALPMAALAVPVLGLALLPMLPATLVSLAPVACTKQPC